MNYLAHLFLAQPKATSRFGNLLGDFMRGSRPEMYTEEVRKGLFNHRWVDKFTDSHCQVIAAKQLISSQRRRFAGIIIDITFDHFLIKHWAQYSDLPLDSFCQSVYQDLHVSLDEMPTTMHKTVQSMLQYQWLTTYQHLDGVANALDNTANRIRFAHNFCGGIEEVKQHYDALENAFIYFFPQLIDAVESAGIENSDSYRLPDSQLYQK